MCPSDAIKIIFWKYTGLKSIEMSVIPWQGYNDMETWLKTSYLIVTECYGNGNIMPCETQLQYITSQQAFYWCADYCFMGLEWFHQRLSKTVTY